MKQKVWVISAIVIMGILAVALLWLGIGLPSPTKTRTNTESVSPISQGQGSPSAPVTALSPSTLHPDTYSEKLATCRALPNHSTQTVRETTRLFLNLPKEIYPDKDQNLRFTTVSGDASAGWISNAGPPGEAFEATPTCWSYYYEFDGSGEVDLQVKSAVPGMPDYFVRFLVTGS